ncbi:hypothetical protein Enr13x_18830 [Stieleria neptunia]|uniref:Uncharacterized protein n=1 Tax=Stieleria neptunia TaxID=2527979 RepID=A0A518HMJ8_9BACT|nr:hypothetical protein Enr13x_18830 [Stieleria neptunia]
MRIPGNGGSTNSGGRPSGHDQTTVNQLPQKNARRRKRRSGRCRQAPVSSVNGGGHRVGAIDLNSKTNSTRRLRCTTWFTRSATTTARASIGLCQCTPSKSPWEISLPLLYRSHCGVGMKPGGLAQCLPVVSATGIESTNLLRPGRPAQWVSRSTPNAGIVSARWALSIPLNPPPVADATGRHSTGPPGLKAVLVLSNAVLVLLLESTGIGLSSSAESTAHLSNRDIKCES